MKNDMKKQNAIIMRIVNVETPRNLLDVCYRLAVALMLSLGICGSIYTSGNEIEALVPVVLAVVVLFCAMTVIASGTRFSKVVYLVQAGVLICIAIVAYSVVTNGTFGIINWFSKLVTMNTGRIVMDISTVGDPVMTQTVAASLFAAALAFLLSLIVNSGRGYLLLIPVIAMTIGIVTGYIAVNAWIFVFAGGVLCGFVYSAQVRSHTRVARKSLWAGLCVAVSVSLVVGVIGTRGLAPTGTEKQKNETEEFFHRLVYDRGENVMPEGLIGSLEARPESEETAMEIVMETPQKMYLRGFTGEVYTGQRWEELTGETVLEASDTFYWLHQDGFFGQTQIAAATVVSDGDVQDSTLNIKNISACKKHSYLPYALSSNTLLDSMNIGDASTVAESDEYNISYIEGSAPEWYMVQAELAVLKDEGNQDAIDYLSLENAYSSYANENYVQVSDIVAEVMQTKMEGYTESMTLLDVKSFILNYLEENMSYNETLYTVTNGTDFFKYVMNQRSMGYDVHYATLATLMLRYFGVPARYVEGYFISAEAAADMTPNEAIDISENYAHAWTEYYLDGVGWIPFEVTPGYMDDEEIILSDMIEDNESLFAQNAGKVYMQATLPDARQNPERMQTEKPTEESSELNSFSNGEILMFILIALIAAIAAFLIVQRVRFTNRINRINNESDSSKSIAMMFGYATQLMLASGMNNAGRGSSSMREATIAWYGGEEDTCGRICILNDEALFSDHILTDENRIQMQGFVKDTLEKAKERWSVGRRIYFKLIKCIY